MAALLNPSTLPGERDAERDALRLLPAWAALPQIMVATLIGSQANYKITIYVYKIMISYEKYSKLNLH